MRLLEKVSETIRDLGLLEGAKRVGVAVSGGVDSVVLLDVLEGLSEERGWELYVLHVEHGIRAEESLRDEAFVRRLCFSKGLPFFSWRVDAPFYARKYRLSLEEAARHLRYVLLEEAAISLGLDVVALGHTADDQVETVLLAFLRGAGVKGLKGMPPRRGIFVRPLIKVWRREVEEYARQRGIKFVEDSSNFNPSFLRNRVRMELLPQLEALNPRIKERILEMSEVLSEEDEALEWALQVRLEALGFSLGRALPKGVLSELPMGLKVRLVARLYEKATGRGLSYRHLLAVKGLFQGKYKKVELPGGICLERLHEDLYFGPSLEKLEEQTFEERTLRVPGITELGQGMAIEAQVVEGYPSEQPGPNVAYLDWDSLSFPLKVRPPKEGDRFVPLGMKGKKKLHDLFVDMKVPRHTRWSIPVVVSGQEICWVAGLRVDDRFKASPSSRKTLVLRLKEGIQ